MKKIVLTSNTSWSLYNFRLSLMRKLKEIGFEVFAVSPADDFLDDLTREFSFYEIKNLDRKGKNPFKDFKLLIEYLKIYSKIKPDLVINYTIKPNIYSSLACRLLGIKSISVITGLGYVYVKEGLIKKLVNTLYQTSLSSNSYVLFLNSEDLRIFIDGKIVKQEKTYLIPGEGVNTDYFNPYFCKNFTEDNVFKFLMISSGIRV